MRGSETRCLCMFLSDSMSIAVAPTWRPLPTGGGNLIINRGN